MNLSMKRSGSTGNRIAAITGLVFIAAMSWGALWHWSASRHDIIQKLRELPVGSRVRLVGVVTYADTPENRFWMEDETGAVVIGVNPDRAGIRVGETVAVEATKTARYDPLRGPASVGLERFRIGPASVRMKLPPGYSISLDSFPTPEKNGIRVEVTGIVRSADLDGLGRASMSIAGSGFEAGMIVARPSGEVSKLVNTEVRITGVPEEVRDSQGDVVSQLLWVASGDDLEIMKAAPERSPLYTIRTLYAGDPNKLGHRVRIRGRIAVAAADSLLIEDRWGATACQISRPSSLKRGAAVEVEGFPGRDGLRIDLSHAVAHAIPDDQIDAADSGERGLSVLRTVKSVRELTPAVAARGLPMRVRGVITYVDPLWRQLFLQDESGGIYVKYSGNLKLEAGGRTKLVGLSAAGAFAPVIVGPKFRMEGTAAFPAPRPVLLASAEAGALDSQYVSVEGVVHPMKFGDNPHHPIMTFDLQTEAGRIHASTAPMSPDRLHAERLAERLNDARVRIRGVFGTIYNSRRQILGYQLLVASPSDIEVIEPAIPDPFSMSATPVGALLRFSPHARLGHRVKVAGTVTIVGPGFLYLQDESGGVEVRGDTRALHMGEAIEVVGYPTLAGRYSPVMTDAVFLSMRRTEKARAEITNPERILQGHDDSTLVTVEGRLLTAVSVPSGTTLILQNGVRTFTAQLDTADLGADLRYLKDGSVLRLTGVCSTQVDPNNLYQLLEDEPVTFMILLRSPADVSIIHAAPFWTLETTLILLALFAVFTLAILMWVGVLRRRVRVQMAALRRAEETAQAIRDLSTAMQNVTSEQRFDAQVSVRGSEDIAQVVVGFNRMLSELQQRDRAKREAEAKLQHMALVDELTGLPNRRLLSDRLSQSLKTAERECRMLALLYIDLDGFKPVNDSLGHGIGDLLLKEVADRLLSRSRESDTPARIGGDEFTLILNAVHSRADAERVAESLLEALTAPFQIDAHLIRIGASIGISLFPEHGVDGDELLQQADFAMYAAKRSGKNRIVEFSDELGNAARERMTLEGELRRAVAEHEITLEYQPEFDLGSKAIVRFEALARWNHAQMGLVPPLSFIPVAEENGLIIPLGAYLMEKACADAMTWKRACGCDVPVAVNVSSVQFARNSFVTEVGEILRRTGLDPGLLQIELTESATLTGIERAAKIMQELKGMEVGLAMDDFGTRYSCLSYLPKLAFDAIKVDRSFVNELILRPETKAFVQSILTMAHNLGMKVVVEGIETEEQLELIRSLGADEAQGYLLGRPTTDPIAQLLHGWNAVGQDGTGHASGDAVHALATVR
jgi:diguanylate cyclase (GGDEF)-like protein